MLCENQSFKLCLSKHYLFSSSSVASLGTPNCSLFVGIFFFFVFLFVECRSSYIALVCFGLKPICSLFVYVCVFLSLSFFLLVAISQCLSHLLPHLLPHQTTLHQIQEIYFKEKYNFLSLFVDKNYLVCLDVYLYNFDLTFIGDLN
jgi:hypothetical protein